MKICTKCNKEKAIKEFTFKNKSLGKRTAQCKECRKIWFKAHYTTNKSYYKKLATIARPKLRQRRREDLYNYLVDKFCVDCGQQNIIVLEFDHLHSKEFSISEMVNKAMGWDRIKEEITKCEIVCANCHRIRTAKRAGWYKSNRGECEDSVKGSAR